MPLTKNKPVEELHDRAHPERDREKNKREAKTQRCRPEKMAETSFFSDGRLNFNDLKMGGFILIVP